MLTLLIVRVSLDLSHGSLLFKCPAKFTITLEEIYLTGFMAIILLPQPIIPKANLKILFQTGFQAITKVMMNGNILKNISFTMTLMKLNIKNSYKSTIQLIMKIHLCIKLLNKCLMIT